MTLKPGERCIQTGRYRCSGTSRKPCSNTIILNKGDIAPPCSVCNQAGAYWTLVTPLT
jgi:hypothetical protein